MTKLADISIYSLTRTMSLLDELYKQEPDVYEDFVRELCAEFTLGKEYMFAIQEMANQEASHEAISQADLTLKHLLAVWVLANDIHIPLATMEQMQ